MPGGHRTVVKMKSWPFRIHAKGCSDCGCFPGGLDPRLPDAMGRLLCIWHSVGIGTLQTLVFGARDVV